MVFDDDLSYLEQCAREIRAYGIQVFYPNDYSIMAVLRNSQTHTVGVVRKVKNIPFYKIFVYKFVPSDLDYFGLEKQNALISKALSEPELIQEIQSADVSGHDEFQAHLRSILKEQI